MLEFKETGRKHVL